MTPAYFPPLPHQLGWAVEARVLTYSEARVLAMVVISDEDEIDQLSDPVAMAVRRYLHWLRMSGRVQ